MAYITTLTQHCKTLTVTLSSPLISPLLSTNPTISSPLIPTLLSSPPPVKPVRGQPGNFTAVFHHIQTPMAKSVYYLMTYRIVMYSLAMYLVPMVVLVALNVGLVRRLNQANEYRSQLMRQVSVYDVRYVVCAVVCGMWCGVRYMKIVLCGAVCGVVLVALNVGLARRLNQANDYRNQLIRQVSVWCVVW